MSSCQYSGAASTFFYMDGQFLRVVSFSWLLVGTDKLGHDSWKISGCDSMSTLLSMYEWGVLVRSGPLPFFVLDQNCDHSQRYMHRLSY